MTLKSILRSTRGLSLAMRAVLGATLVLAGVAALVAPSASAADHGARTHLASPSAFSRDRNRLGSEGGQRESVR